MVSALIIFGPLLAWAWALRAFTVDAGSGGHDHVLQTCIKWVNVA